MEEGPRKAKFIAFLSPRHGLSCRPQGERHQDCEEAGMRGALNPWVFLGLPWKQQGEAG